MATDPHEPADTNLLARGGGNATAAGVSFQASVGAIFATELLAERLLDDRLRLGEARIRSLRFETEAPLDDILIETDASGWVFVQVKTTLSLSESLDSEFGKTVEQIVRQWRVSATGGGQRGWDRRLALGRDRMLIVVGPDASGSISRDLATGLASLQAPWAAPMPQAPEQALTKLTGLIKEAWQKIIGVLPSADEFDSVLRLITVVKFDMAGPDRTAAIETLTHVTEDAAVAPGAFDTIVRHCENLMAARRGTNAAELRRSLARSGLRLRSVPSYQWDVEALRVYSADIQSHLHQYEDTRVEGVDIRIERACASAVVSAAPAGSLVIVGEPGAGKSAVVSAAAERLRSEGHEVIELAVDRLPVDSLDGLHHEIGLSHRLRDVLENWPGADAAFLFIDALDATRGGRSEAVFRTLISDALDLPGGRWRVIASIRTFDLRLGEQFRKLFQGVPPDPAFADREFAGVRHVHVPCWTDDELAELLERAPALSTAVWRGGERLRDLALVPFNTRLLADLINGGVAAEALGEVGTQIELLAMYWRHRVQGHGHGAEVCLKSAVAQMVANRSLQARRIETAEADPTASDNLTGGSVSC
jgi:hypothetical protein